MMDVCYTHCCQKDEINGIELNGIVIIGNTHSKVCAMRLKNYLNNKFEVNGLVKPRTGVYIVLNSTIKDIVNLTKSDVIFFVVVSMTWVRLMPR
jgi:hypothetical protein